MSLDNLRSSISALDSELLSLLHKRLELTHQVGECKVENGIEILDPIREENIIANIRDNFTEDQEGIESLWRELMYISKREQNRTLLCHSERSEESLSNVSQETSGISSSKVQEKVIPDGMTKRRRIRIGIQGGKGSFNDIAIRDFLSEPHSIGQESVRTGDSQSPTFQDPNILYLYTTEAVLEALNNGSIDYGQFALANSIGGIVHETITKLGNYRWRYLTDYSIPVRHSLLLHPDVNIREIMTIMGHEQAIRQCAQTLDRLFPGIQKIGGTGDLTDNASIALAVASGILPKTTAAIGHESLADIYDLTIAQRDIQDRNDNETTFVLVSR